MSIKGSRTEQNLFKAFAGESQARTRYTYFASAAKTEGFEQISASAQMEAFMDVTNDRYFPALRRTAQLS